MAQDSSTQNSQETKITQVGVLLVHGIGKQKQFEHLICVVRSIAQALKNDDSDGSLDVQITVRTRADAAFGAEQKTWAADTSAPVIVTVKDQLGSITQLEFHEVWWADLGEPTTLPTLTAFWYWGLSLWATTGYFINRTLDTFEKQMRSPQKGGYDTPKVTYWERFILFGVSLIALLILPFIAAFSRLFAFFDIRILPLDALSQYLSRVQIFQQKNRYSPEPLEDFDQPPRVAIRRRMVQALVNMALQDYDRWYILAHSQGTILAFNGLMEAEQTLPNYLSKALWKKAKKRRFYKLASATDQQAWGAMRPKRPHWLKPKDLLDRKELFAKLRGFMTYGSPLKKFARLWPAIVYLNTDEQVFQPNFEWINVYDPTDPVASPTEFFEPIQPHSETTTDQNQALKPCDIAYKADSLHLISHMTYLNYRHRRKDRLVNSVSEWLLKGLPFRKPPEVKPWFNTSLVALRILIWWILGFYVIILLPGLLDLLNRLLLGLLGLFIFQPPPVRELCLSSLCWGNSLWVDYMFILIGGCGIVVVAGVIYRIQQLCDYYNVNKAQDDLEDYLSQNGNRIFARKILEDKFAFYSRKTLNKALHELVKQQALRRENNNFFFPVTLVELSPKAREEMKNLSVQKRKRLADFVKLVKYISYNPYRPCYPYSQSQPVDSTFYLSDGTDWMVANPKADIVIYYKIEQEAEIVPYEGVELPSPCNIIITSVDNYKGVRS